MGQLLFGTTVLTAVVAGMVALLAPCCISVMLPAFFANSFRRRRALVSMTAVFALGVATVILPVGFGATALSRLVIGQHFAVFLIGGLAMIALGLATATGWRIPLPMPGMRAGGRNGSTGSVYFLGLFSGVASACCAPVLAGVVALSGASGSFIVSTVTGVAYVFGMVLPLFLLALVWDRRDWGASRLLKGRTFHLRILGQARAVHSSSLIGATLLVAMGGLTVVQAFTGTSMDRKGWQSDVASWLDHAGNVIVRSLSYLPGWITALAAVAALGLIARVALRQAIDTEGDPETTATEPHSLLTETPEPITVPAGPAPTEGDDQ